VVDLADWDATRVALPGGQCGNPLSPHYDDQLPAYRSGAGIPLPWSPTARAAAVERTLHLAPT
jgi:penicillin G amidase